MNRTGTFPAKTDHEQKNETIATLDKMQ